MPSESTELVDWAIVTNRTQLRQFLANISVPESILQPYIVRHVDSIDMTGAENATSTGMPDDVCIMQFFEY